MKIRLLLVLAVFLESCKKEDLSAFSEGELAAIHIQNGTFELMTRLVALHDLMNQGGSNYINGAITRDVDTIGSHIYDTLRYYKKNDNSYVHSFVPDYSCSVRDTAATNTSFVINLNDFSWNNAVFNGEIHYSYSNLMLTTINLNAFSVRYKNTETSIDGLLFGNKSNYQHLYNGYLNGSGGVPFEWQIDDSYTLWGDYLFSSINTIPSAVVFSWDSGKSTLNVKGVKIRQIIDGNFYQYNKAMMVHDNEARRILEFPQF